MSLPEFKFTPKRREYLEACLFTEWGLPESTEYVADVYHELQRMYAHGSRFVQGHNLGMMLTMIRDVLKARDSFPQG